jgi:hypothetical protein
MAYKDVPKSLVAEKGIVDRKHGTARVAEYEFHPLLDQAFDQDAGAAALFTHNTFLLNPPRQKAQARVSGLARRRNETDPAQRLGRTGSSSPPASLPISR